MSTYLTDSWSTISGLAAVAYGSPGRYQDVANQVRRKSVLGFLGPTPPSDIIANVLKPEHIVSALQGEYVMGEGFTEYVDTGSKTVTEIGNKLYENIVQAYNEFGTYESSLTDALEYVSEGLGINNQRVKDKLLASVSDLELFSRMAANVPTNKLDKLPAGTRIDLDDSVNLDTDQNGIALTTGYLTPDQYWNEVAYPGVGSTADNLPNTFVTSLTEGYKGYATLQPLDDLLRPGLAALVSLADINDLRNVARSVAGIGTVSTAKDLTGLGRLSPADEAMYDLDLSEIIVERNGYTVYDPLIDSNGDFIDPVNIPDYNALNVDSGLPYSSRTRSLTF